MISSDPFECPASLLEKARDLPPISTAVAGADGELALESAKRATETGLIEPCLVGDLDQISKMARTIDWDISDYRQVDAKGEIATFQGL